MKIFDIFALSALIVMVKGTLWAAAVQPVILSIGALLTAIDLDVLDINLSLPFINKQSKSNYDADAEDDDV